MNNRGNSIQRGRGGGGNSNSNSNRGDRGFRGGAGRGRGGGASPALSEGPQGRGGYQGGGGGPGGFSRGGGPGPIRSGFFVGRGGGGGGSVIYAGNTPAQIPERLSDANHQQLIASFKSLEVIPDRPLRPGYGTVGTPITLRANFYAVDLPEGPFYDYVVRITPRTDINRLKIRIFELLELSPLWEPHLPYVAHDRSQRMVSARKLPQPLDIQVPFYGNNETEAGPEATVYTVSIKFERELDISQLKQYQDGQIAARDYNLLPLLSAFHLIAGQHPSRTGVRVGENKYFFPPPAGQKLSLGPGVEAWQGFYASFRPTFKQLMVNVNVCMTAFVEPGNVADALMALSRNSRGAMPTLRHALVKSIKVRTQHLGHSKPIKAIGTTSARNTFFDCPELGGRVSVEQYFKKKYNKTLKFPADLPVIDIGSGKRTNWVPAELCDIEPGNPYRGKLNDKETAQMIRFACNPPRVNAEAIVNKGFPILGLAPAQAPMDGFGISFDSEMAVVPGRELSPPRLTYQVGGKVKVSNGSWNILDVKFHRGVTVSSWWVMIVRDGYGTVQGPDDPRLTGLLEGFAAKLRRSGVSMPGGRPRLLPTPVLPPLKSDPGRLGAIDVIRKIFKEALVKGPRPSFVLVLLENRDNYIYPGIKRLGDVELGIHTVHMQLSRALGEPRKQDQYFSNVALKVNTKLGGMNHLLEPSSMKWLTKKKTMLVGIDVTHPGPGSREGTPSIAAVVANVDDTFVQFPASLRIQQSKKEMLDELRDMLIERLLLYEKKNKVLPERIYVFRDGVSEGQYDTVLKEELAQILEAFKKLSSTAQRKNTYRPQLSIIICGKRHHARFSPTEERYTYKDNTRPGTVVDKGVTGVFDFDFYLQAHAGLQGHVKATHYTVVYDESALAADELQQGTHDACYLYARATKAVSLIPPAYYADLACERGRCYLNDFLVDDKASVSGRGRDRLDVDEERARVFNAARDAWGDGLHAEVRESMFYI